MSLVAKNLADLLLRLDHAASKAGVTNMSGLAIAKDDTSLHLAVENGVVAIPFDEIVNMGLDLDTSSPEIIWLEVKNADRIRTIRTASSQMIDAFTPSSALKAMTGTGTNECEGSETSSKSGGEEDACDDFRQHCTRDS